MSAREPRIRPLSAALGGVALALLTIAACSGTSGASQGSSSDSSSGAPPGFVTMGESTAANASAPGTAAPPPAPSRPAAFDLCRLLPPDTVAHLLEGAVRKPALTATKRTGGMCSYREPATGEPRVLVTVDLGRDRSAATASVGFLSIRGQLGTQGIRTTDIPNLGDQAFGSSDSTGSYAVYLQQGALTARVNVRVSGASAATLRPAAIALSRSALGVLR